MSKPRTYAGGWCRGGPASGDSKLTFVKAHDRGGRRPRPRRTRCPECNKLLTQRVVSCHDGWYAGIPHHKPKKA